MGSFSKNAALLAIGFWLGCAVLFAAVVAPTLFNPDVAGGLSRNMAGAIAGAILRRIYLITYICMGVAAFFLLMASFGEAKGARGPRRAFILCLLVLGLNALNDQWVLDRINKVKVEMANAMDSELEGLKKRFDKWHRTSTWVYGGAVVCGFVAAVCLLPSVAGSKSKKTAK